MAPRPDKERERARAERFSDEMGCAQSSIGVMMEGDGGGDGGVEKAYKALEGEDFQALKDNFDAPHGETCAPSILFDPSRSRIRWNVRGGH